MGSNQRNPSLSRLMKEYINKRNLSKEEAMKMQMAFIDFGYIQLPL